GGAGGGGWGWGGGGGGGAPVWWGGGGGGGGGGGPGAAPPTSIARAPAREVVHRARREGALVGGQPGDERGDLFRLADASHRDLRHEHVHRRAFHLLEQLGADHGRRDGVDENPLGRDLLGERLGESDDAGLGRGVRHE